MRISTTRKAVSPRPIELPRLLLVEGETPLNFFDALTGHLGLSDRVEIRSFGGVHDLREFLPALVASAGFRQVKKLGIIRDCEVDPAAAAQSLRDLIEHVMIDRSRVDISWLLLPDEKSPGMLETLLWRAIEQSPTAKCVDRFFKCATEAGKQLAMEKLAFDKNRVQAYLATTSSPQTSPGVAAQRNVWNFEDTVFESLRTFIRNLCD